MSPGCSKQEAANIETPATAAANTPVASPVENAGDERVFRVWLDSDAGDVLRVAGITKRRPWVWRWENGIPAITTYFDESDSEKDSLNLSKAELANIAKDYPNHEFNPKNCSGIMIAIATEDKHTGESDDSIAYQFVVNYRYEVETEGSEFGLEFRRKTTAKMLKTGQLSNIQGRQDLQFFKTDEDLESRKLWLKLSPSEVAE
jgi:hypothetical protein